MKFKLNYYVPSAVLLVVSSAAFSPLYAQQQAQLSPEDAALAAIARRAQSNQQQALPVPGSDPGTPAAGAPPTQEQLDNAASDSSSPIDLSKVNQPIVLAVHVSGRIDRYAPDSNDGGTLRRTTDSRSVMSIHASIPFLRMSDVSVPFIGTPSNESELSYSDGVYSVTIPGSNQVAEMVPKKPGGPLVFAEYTHDQIKNAEKDALIQSGFVDNINSMLSKTGYKIDTNHMEQPTDSRDSGRADRVDSRQVKKSLGSDLVEATPDGQPDLYGSLSPSMNGDGSWYLSYQPYTITIRVVPEKDTQ
jgi:hypothetical protein